MFDKKDKLSSKLKIGKSSANLKTLNPKIIQED